MYNKVEQLQILRSTLFAENKPQKTTLKLNEQRLGFIFFKVFIIFKHMHLVLAPFCHIFSDIPIFTPIKIS